MLKKGFRRVIKSGVFVWPWTESHGLLVIGGALGGGGSGGGATSVKRGKTTYQAAGGNGGDGGGGGELHEGKPVEGKHGKGCHYGDGGDGGRGAVVPPTDGRLASNGGNGGKGFPGETQIVELADLSVGDRFEIKIGRGGGGGGGGKGYKKGDVGVAGADGCVLFVPVLAEEGDR